MDGGADIMRSESSGVPLGEGCFEASQLARQLAIVRNAGESAKIFALTAGDWFHLSVSPSNALS